MKTFEYQADMGEINLTNEMVSILQGLSIEEQSKHFAVVVNDDTTYYSYGERDGGRHSESTVEAEQCHYAKGWIVKDGIIVGIVFSNYSNKLVYTFLDSSCCTYFCVDDDGTGSTDVSVYCKLVWIA